MRPVCLRPAQGRQRQRKSQGGAELRRGGRGQLMQRAAGQPAAEGGIDRGQAERQQFFRGKGKTLVFIDGCERLPEMAERAAGSG